MLPGCTIMDRSVTSVTFVTTVLPIGRELRYIWDLGPGALTQAQRRAADAGRLWVPAIDAARPKHGLYRRRGMLNGTFDDRNDARLSVKQWLIMNEAQDYTHTNLRRLAK